MKNVRIEAPNGKVMQLDLFEFLNQLIIYRAFFEYGVHGGRSFCALATPPAPIKSPT